MVARSVHPSSVNLSMLFLMNDVVLDLGEVQPSAALPRRAMKALSVTSVTRLGRELYADEPLLHAARPDRARRLAALIAAKAPEVNAALFTAPEPGCEAEAVDVRLAQVSPDTMRRLTEAQAAGALDVVAADRSVWRRFDA